VKEAPSAARQLAAPSGESSRKNGIRRRMNLSLVCRSVAADARRRGPTRMVRAMTDIDELKRGRGVAQAHQTAARRQDRSGDASRATATTPRRRTWLRLAQHWPVLRLGPGYRRCGNERAPEICQLIKQSEREISHPHVPVAPTDAPTRRGLPSALGWYVEGFSA